jgi:hypothetical protein
MALVELIAPQLDRRDLHRALAGEVPEHWPEPPQWHPATEEKRAVA